MLSSKFLDIDYHNFTELNTIWINYCDNYQSHYFTYFKNFQVIFSTFKNLFFEIKFCFI